MTLMQLRYFQALAGALNYTKTAEALHISQPSLSYAIAELEKDLGIPVVFQKKTNAFFLRRTASFSLPM